MTKVRSLKPLMLRLQFFNSIFNLTKTLVKMLVAELDALCSLLLEIICSICKGYSSNKKFKHKVSVMII
jgi:hypothetical protein